MTTKSERNPSESSRGLIPWRKRATYRVSSNRKQRQAQYQQQTNVLLVALLVTVVVGGLFIYSNWRGAGSTKTVSCTDYPQYCVPLAGGGTGSDEIAKNETASLREIKPEESKGAPGVVRGLRDDMPFLGNPDAPIHFVMFSDFACPHCQDFHETDLDRFLADYVLTGKATYQIAMLTGTGGADSANASQAMLCAGEQGAMWEMNDELFRLGKAMVYPQTAFSLNQLGKSAEQMGLDKDKLLRCVSSGRYINFMNEYRTLSNDNGVTGTPTIMYRYSENDPWSMLQDRTYAGMAQMTNAANANAQ